MKKRRAVWPFLAALCLAPLCVLLILLATPAGSANLINLATQVKNVLGTLNGGTGGAITAPTVNGYYPCGFNVTSGTAQPMTCGLSGLLARSVHGTTSTDTILYSDNNNVVEYEGSVAVAVSLPTPTSLGNAHLWTVLNNVTTGSSTAVTVTTAGSWTVNGSATLTIAQGQECSIAVDPNPGATTNWLGTCSVPAGSGGSVTCASLPALTGNVTTSAGSCATSVASQYTKLRCEGGLGDGLNAIASGTYVQLACVNTSGVTWTITGISCFVDNGSATSTLNAANNAGTDLLTGAVTCDDTKSAGGAAGTQSSTTTLANNDAINFTFVADGTSKTTTWTVSFTQ